MPNTHRRRDSGRRDCSKSFTTDLVDKLKTEHVENLSSRVAELATGSQQLKGEYTPSDTTQLDSTEHVQFSIFLPNPSAVVVS